MPSGVRSDLRKTKEKTPDRIPFSVLVTSRVELRSLSGKRPGAGPELRLGQYQPAQQRPGGLGETICFLD